MPENDGFVAAVFFEKCVAYPHEVERVCVLEWTCGVDAGMYEYIVGGFMIISQAFDEFDVLSEFVGLWYGHGFTGRIRVLECMIGSVTYPSFYGSRFTALRDDRPT